MLLINVVDQCCFKSMFNAYNQNTSSVSSAECQLLVRLQYLEPGVIVGQIFHPSNNTFYTYCGWQRVIPRKSVHLKRPLFLYCCRNAKQGCITETPTARVDKFPRALESTTDFS